MDHRRRATLTISLAVVLLAGCAESGAARTDPSSSGQPTAAPAVSAAPAATPSARPSLLEPSSPPLSTELPTRLVVADLGIDLPIVSGDLTAPGNPPDYPLCNVAQYLTIFRFPGRPGTTTWIYGHARPGMLLPLLEASTVDNGSRLIGGRVEVYSDAGNRFTYRITEVLRHATDRAAARDVPPGSRRLVLQTSEGPRGTVPKLQVVAELVNVAEASRSEAMPKPSPVGCFQG